MCLITKNVRINAENLYKCDRACENQPSERKKNRRLFSSLLYHNLQTIYDNKKKSLSPLQNFMGFPLNFTETEYLNQSRRY